jgi:hypothetical protein
VTDDISSEDPEQVWEELLDKVRTMRAEGMTRFQIERKLQVDWDIDEDTAWDAVSMVYRYKTQERASKKRSWHNLIWGPIYFIGGVGLTAISYIVGNDSFLVFWGAIIVGALMFIAGVIEVWSNFLRE